MGIASYSQYWNKQDFDKFRKLYQAVLDVVISWRYFVLVLYIKDIPKELLEDAKFWRVKMLEAAAEANENLLEKFLENGELSIE